MQKTITSPTQDYSQWYQDVIAAAELAEHSDVKGSMIIKPYGYALWERMQRVLDDAIKQTGAQNAYFPLLIPESYLRREKEHVEGFSPELAVVTHAGGEKLADPLVVRPTSETIINISFSKWIQSWRDLPLMINQWANVIRWELRPRLFLRTTEFLWQEGHTAHATNAEAEEEARRMLEVYRAFIEEYLAVPVITGQKTDTEKFAGADRTYALEAIMPEGKALQMGTSHNLGQNFAKAFGVKFLNKQNVEEFAWQTSWGVSTRMIGGLIMTHGDDKGLVMPPKIAPMQVVILPIGKTDSERSDSIKEAEAVKRSLESADLRVHIDTREETLGTRIYHWEKKGVPVRLELGPKDIAAKKAMITQRVDSHKESLPIASLADAISAILDGMQNTLFERAQKKQTELIRIASTHEEFAAALENNQAVYAPWAGTSADEAVIKEKYKATVRCMPFTSPIPEGTCVVTGKPTTTTALFARAY